MWTQLSRKESKIAWSVSEETILSLNCKDIIRGNEKIIKEDIF